MAARIMQCVLAGVLAAISVGLLVSLHRLQVDVGVVRIPAGLLLGVLFQGAASIFLISVTGSRLPAAVLAAAWGIMVMPFAGRGAGGGVLMPAVIAEQAQYAGWIVQGIGVLVPFAVIAGETVRRRRSR
ncbi:hypothetical protein [Brachybacterium phenoliresistens]|uniref:Uncharacterized protein n=1 Tax=Brachybacterium phenoliresistens TaxID=396014 RepID=Z9JR90_9MICO|nr:hypothetical protein [Brachybacterium phenoliresistens]EWS80709.1 hypothetical protein BF93_02360 [Brachybacterium phenoliresistens]